MKHLFLLISLLVLVLFSSCEKIVHVEAKEDYSLAEYEIAVILPMKDNLYRERWQRTAAWALENMERAQTGLENRIKLNIKWIEEEREENTDSYLASIGQELASDSDVKVVIGPRTSSHVDIVSKYLAKQKKMMIAPTATSAEVLRKYSGKGFFWALCEPDITQCEVLLTKAQGYGATSVGLIASNSIYGQTFIDWFAFQAQEMGLKVAGLYSNKEMDDALKSGADYLICVPDDLDEMTELLNKSEKMNQDKMPKLLFSDIALDPTLLSYGSLVEQVEGVSPYADPSSGFEIAYTARFGSTPSFVEVQLFDAIMLAGLVIHDFNNRKIAGETFQNENVAINDIMCSLMAMEDANGSPLPKINAWSYEGMYSAMHNVGKYNISGASGTLDFDVSMQSPVTCSVYCHWMVYENNFLPLDFLSSHGSRRTGSTTTAWEWRASVTQEISDMYVANSYASLESQWAVLVCGSRGWFNYRHQTDVLNMYHLLRRNGFSDDHIILVASPEDILYDSHNLYSGEIRSEINGPNLYSDVEIDYSTDSLSAADITKILLGEQSAHLPKVLNTNEHTNLFFYWSGHGEFGKFLWGRADSHFTSEMLYSTISYMCNNGKFRKMLICGEPCYSGSVLNATEGFPGVLSIASANTHESSFADIYDSDMGVWLSDRFSNRIINEIGTNPNQSFRDLYLSLVHDTYGSHVNIINYSMFDNLYYATPAEFFVSQER